MKVSDLSIEGLKLIELDVYKDDRGFFVERFNEEKFKELGLATDYVQDNHSRSKPGVIRGLHYQAAGNGSEAMAKLVGCIRGRILDVAVDIRVGSPSFGKFEAVELSGDNSRLLYIPAGFAHGFCVLGDEEADVFYKVDELFNKELDNGINLFDAQININWPVKNAILSDKDKGLQTLEEYLKNPAFYY